MAKMVNQVTAFGIGLKGGGDVVTMSREAATAAWHRSDEEREFWLAHRQEYLKKYPDQFVAVKDSVVVATGTNLGELLAELKKRGLKPTDVWVRHFNPHPSSTFF